MTGREIIDWAIKRCKQEELPPTDSNILLFINEWELTLCTNCEPKRGGSRSVYDHQCPVEPKCPNLEKGWNGDRTGSFGRRTRDPKLSFS